MRCPRCSDAELRTQETLAGVVADTCLRCRGVWLDEGELEALLGAEAGSLLDRGGEPNATACPRWLPGDARLTSYILTHAEWHSPIS